MPINLEHGMIKVSRFFEECFGCWALLSPDRPTSFGPSQSVRLHHIGPDLPLIVCESSDHVHTAQPSSAHLWTQVIGPRISYPTSLLGKFHIILDLQFGATHDPAVNPSKNWI